MQNFGTPSLAQFIPPKPSLTFRTVDEYIDQDFPVRHDIIDNAILPTLGRMMVGAAKGVGKTTMLTQVMCELGSGSPALGLFDVPRPVRVMLLQKEVDSESFSQRVEQVSQHYSKLDPSNVLVPNREDIIDLKLDTAQGIQLLTQCIIYYKPDVVMLDPIVWFHNMDEDKATDVKKLLAALDKMILQYHVAMIISHHFGKTQHDNRGRPIDQNLQSLRGSSVWGDWCDTAIWMNDRGNDKALMDMFVRHGKEEPPTVLLTRNRKYNIFEAEIQGMPTTAGEYAVVQILNREPSREMMYSDLEYQLKVHKIGERQAKVAISSMRAKNNVYFIGIGGNRIVRLLTPQARQWLK